ncbi:MAG: glycosyltransferase family 4 protein, partial [Planctomycetes bacterium]|nr:glycosyltransferase family 4 protein [Planctomycetota bacterium]
TRVPDGGRESVLLVGSLEQMYKGCDILIRAAASIRKDRDFSISVAGDGRCRSRLEQLTAELGMVDRVRFLGHVTDRGELRALLDRTTLFVMPSRTEGLPRALIEAMARGCPCIGSSVGGIVELLPAEDLVPPGDVPALARRLQAALSDADWQRRSSARNRARAEEFRDDQLKPRRESFYRAVRDATAAGHRSG